VPGVRAIRLRQLRQDAQLDRREADGAAPDEGLVAQQVDRDVARAPLALAGALAGLAGTLMVAQFGGLGFAGGFQLGLKALIAAILGGIGSVPGALVGGLSIGAFETLWSATMPIEGRDIALYSVLIVVLVFRPGGLFGFAEPRGHGV
jgi:branched-subunit amino acid ABC-type transport system permease component